MQTLIKNTNAYRLLKTEAAQRRFSHAYLLLLDDERNLRSALKTFAKVLFSCDEPNDTHTQTVANRIDAESFTDCLFFPDADKKFVVEDCERVMEESLLKPVESDKKVFVISGFDQANPASQNKLLKLLEEPPKHVIFLLGATTAYPLLSTVLSRVSKLEILPFSQNALTQALARVYGDKYSPTDYALCAAASGGSLGTAQNTLEGGDYKTLINDAFSLCLCTGATLPPLIKKIGETKQKKQLLFLLRLIYRDAAVLKSTGKQKDILLPSELARLRQVTEKYTLSALLFAQDELSKAEKQTFFNAVFSQCLEVTISNVLFQNAKDKRKQS